MPPKVGSRYANSYAFQDDEGRLVLSEREPFLFRDLDDNLIHNVVDGDTLWGIADAYFQPLPRAAGYWWAVADFQPEAIVDPTLALEVGRQIVVPSLRTLTEQVLGTGVGVVR